MANRQAFLGDGKIKKHNLLVFKFLLEQFYPVLSVTNIRNKTGLEQIVSGKMCLTHELISQGQGLELIGLLQYEKVLPKGTYC